MNKYLENKKFDKKKLGAIAATTLLIGGVLGGAGYGIGQGINSWGRPTPVINSTQNPTQGAEATNSLQDKLIALYIVERATAMFEDVSAEYTEEVIKASFKNPANMEETVSVSFTLDEDDRIKLIANEGDHTFFDIEDELNTNDYDQYYLKQKPYHYRARIINVNDIEEGEADSGFFRTDKNLVDATFDFYRDELFITENEEENTEMEMTVQMDVIQPNQNVSLDNPRPAVNAPETRQINTELNTGAGRQAVQDIYDHFFEYEEDMIMLHQIVEREAVDNHHPAGSAFRIIFPNHPEKLITVSGLNEEIDLQVNVYGQWPDGTLKRNSENIPDTAANAIDYIEKEIEIIKLGLETRTNPRNAVPAPEVGASTEEQGAALDDEEEMTDIDFIQDSFSAELLEGKVLGLGDSDNKMTMEVWQHPTTQTPLPTESLATGKLRFHFEIIEGKTTVKEVSIVTNGGPSTSEVELRIWSMDDPVSPESPSSTRSFQDDIMEIKTAWEAYIDAQIEDDRLVELNVPPVLEPESEVLIIYTTPTIQKPQPAIPNVAPSPAESTPVSTSEINDEEGSNLDNQDLSQREVDSVQVITPPDVQTPASSMASTSNSGPSPQTNSMIAESMDSEDQDEDEQEEVPTQEVPTQEAPVIGGDGNDQVTGFTLPWTQSSLSERLKVFFSDSPGWTVKEETVGTPATNPVLRIQRGNFFFKIEFWQESIKYQFKEDVAWWKVWKGIGDPVLDEQIFTYDNANALFEKIANTLTTPVS